MHSAVTVLVLLHLLISCNSLLKRNYLQTCTARRSIRTLLNGIASTAATSLGAPKSKPRNCEYLTDAGIRVSRVVEDIANSDVNSKINDIVRSLDDFKGIILKSSYEFPGRYARWTIGFLAPPLQIEGRGYNFTISALNERGEILIQIIRRHLAVNQNLFHIENSGDCKNISLKGFVRKSSKYFAEEERSKQPTLFSLVRSIKDIFSSGEDDQIGLYGALGYDLTYQFEHVEMRKDRPESQRDLVLYLPDEILVVDNQKNVAWNVKYDFSESSFDTARYPRRASMSAYEPCRPSNSFQTRDTPSGKFAQSVIRAKEEFKVGNLFEVVLSQVFRRELSVNPSTVFLRLCRRNPSPYGFFMNLGREEYLVGASPEMFVRVEATSQGMRVETCPISGTIERGDTPLEDALQIKKLLLSSKEESELTMCTDVDRNDKSRICIPGSVKVLGRRQIEMYSRLIHTVDHVEGYLRNEFDALDAFLCHTWAVTVTGAPKTWAIRFIENFEPSPRFWYGGAVGVIGFDGTLNTGLTLRTVRVHKGIAEVRAGATLLHDSDPISEEAETELKASAMLDAIIRADDDEINAITKPSLDVSSDQYNIESMKKVLLIDHEDSFVHTLANYLRQTGAEVLTCRSGPNLSNFIDSQIDTAKFTPDLVVLSPGPGNPSDFHLSESIDKMIKRKIPIFGVCLGLQGIVEHFGGKLNVLAYPMHGKPSAINRIPYIDENADGSSDSRDVLSGLPDEFQVARYHSLHADIESFPKELKITAESKDGIVMAIQHKHMPIAAVQFHPESILTLPKHGMTILLNALERLSAIKYD